MNDTTIAAGMPSDEEFREDFGLSGRKRRRATPPGFRDWGGGLIAEPGAYRNVPNDFYHGNGEWHGKEPCTSPSISASGLKVLVANKGQRVKGQSPRHYWQDSNLNPNRQPREVTPALTIGKAFNDALLLPGEYDDRYYVLPKGFSRAQTVKQAVEIAAADAALKAGMTLLSEVECVFVNALVDSMRADPWIAPLLDAGEPEVTLAWKDEETGVWLRARPDILLPDLSAGINIKTAADASYTGFSRAIAAQGYAQGAALELDGYRAVFGEAPPRYLHPVIEKPATAAAYEEGDYLATALWVLPEEDIERGRWLNRMAIRLFADCLAADKWPGYTPEPELCGLPSYARNVIDNGGAAEPADDEIEA